MLSELLVRPEGRVALFLGPEGGYTREEIDLLTEKGVRPASLGPLTLRADTAAVAACAVVTAARQMWYGTG